MDRVFLDANVLFSVAYGSPDFERLWKEARAGRCTLLASLYVVEETRRNLPPARLQRFEDRLLAVEIVPGPPAGSECPVLLPEKDRPVLLAAVASGATHLLTGDRKDFGPYFRKRVLGVLILPPAEYLR